MTITIKDMHRDIWIEDDCEDWARERAYLDSIEEFEYKSWLEEQNSKNKPITKVEIREEKIKQEELWKEELKTL